MNVVQRRAHLVGLFLWIGALSLIAAGCENPGSVGDSFSTHPQVVVDTLTVGQVDVDSVGSMYSGSLSYFSAGALDDPQFGHLQATGLIKPSRYASNSSVDSIGDNANVWLKFKIDQADVYGDSLQQQSYDLVEINQLWRARAWKYGNEVQLSSDGPVASFTVGREDSIEVPLSSSWVNKYKTYFESTASNADSTYKYNFFGLAIVPKNSQKILPFNPSGSQLVIARADSDTLNVPMSEWAISLQQSNKKALPAHTYDIYNNMQHVLKFNMDLSKDRFGTVNISNVDLVLYQDDTDLDQTIGEISSSAQRPPVTYAELHYINPAEAYASLFPGNPILTGSYKAGDGGFHFNITRFANAGVLGDLGSTNEFYITLQSNNGILGNSLIYNTDAPADKKPKLIVTILKSPEN